MLTYLDKFNNLPPDLRDSISTPEALQAIEEIEKKYDISLASVVMRVMVKEISIVDLPKYFVFEYGVDGRQAEEIVDELKVRVFLAAADYLGFAIGETEVAADQDKFNTWVQNKNSEADVRGSSFFFSPEDEEEVRELTKKVETFTPAKEEIAKEDDENENKVDLICKQLRVSFSSEELNSRFRKIIGIYIKGVRNKVDTKQTLIKDIETGGLSMDPIYVDNILLVADKVSSELTEAAKTSKATDKQQANIRDLQKSGVRDVEYDFASLAKRPKPEEKKEVATENKEKVLQFVDDNKVSYGDNKKNEVIDLTKLNVENSNIDNEAGELSFAESKNVTNDIAPASKFVVKEEGAMPINMASARKTAANDKMKFNDVKFVPKLTGPVDELGELDLVNFRRLNSNSESAVDKIKQKISNLEEENYVKKLAGIKSWRQSPVNRLYLEIGQESLAKKKSVSEIIEERANNNQEYLTNEEFEAIMNLNKEMKY